MPGLDPGIHVFPAQKEDVDGRDKPGHDERAHYLTRDGEEERVASPAMAKQDERCVVVAAPLELVEARGRGKGRIRRILDDGERAGSEPAARTRSGECPFGERAPIRRVEEGERERRQRMNGTELDRVAAENARDAAQAQRLDVLAQELGLGGLDCGSWASLSFPKGTPDEIVRHLAKAVNEAVETPAVRERFKSIGVTIPPPERRTPEYLAKFVPSEIERWAAPIKASGASEE